jgi:uncharacterized protein YeaO (DUF488 family)
VPLDEWAKELAPSTDLRKRFGHDPARWEDFRSSYRAELTAQAAKKKLEELAARARRATLTLIYSASDPEHNNAVVLLEILSRLLKKKAS